jgi:hypothetical protein
MALVASILLAAVMATFVAVPEAPDRPPAVAWGVVLARSDTDGIGTVGVRIEGTVGGGGLRRLFTARRTSVRGPE